MSAAAVVGCDIHVMDARQSVNWSRYIEDDDYFREGGASNHSFLDAGYLEESSFPLGVPYIEQLERYGLVG